MWPAFNRRHWYGRRASGLAEPPRRGAATSQMRSRSRTLPFHGCGRLDPHGQGLRLVTRIVSDGAVEEVGWHPLDGVPAPEYIPPAWDGVHAGKRLAEALRTLR